MGAAFNNLMEEESKESLAKMCCDLMDQLNARPKTYEFLNPDFLKLMNDIGRLGHEKFKDSAFEIAGKSRQIPRHRKEEILHHARKHLFDYEKGRLHDKLGILQGHMGAAAFNCMLEYIFSQGE